MASGRKLVVTGIYYSNPYVSYIDRKKDCDKLLNSFSEEQVNVDLLDQYDVKYLIIKKSDEEMYSKAKVVFPNVAYTDNDYLIRKK
jgi:hypothetical protein